MDDKQVPEYVRFVVLRVLEGEAEHQPTDCTPIDDMIVEYGRDDAVFDSWGSREDWWDKVQRLRKWYKRYQFAISASGRSGSTKAAGCRDDRRQPGLPDHVVKAAARYLRSASETRLPGGRMA